MVTSDAASSLKTNMRKLWADHLIWTRLYIIAAVEGSSLSKRLTSVAGGVVTKLGKAIGGAISLAGPGDAAAVRLLKNQSTSGTPSSRCTGRTRGSSSPLS